MKVATRYNLVESQPYIIHDRPDETLPVSRLIREGSEVLTVSELVEIAIGRSVSMDKALRDYGSGILKTLTTAAEISETLKIDHVQAIRLLAALSLGRRLFDPSQGAMPVLRDSQDVFVHVRSIASQAREHLKVLLLNSRYQLLHEEVLAVGSTDYLQVQPRDVFQAAIERRAPAIILVHNHPSDNATPSAADREFTKRMAEAGTTLGVELLDHLVITREAYASCLT